MKRKASTAVNRPYKKPRQAAPAAVSRINPKSVKRTPELKNIDGLSTTAYAAGATTGLLTLLNGVDDGTTPITRIGRRITMKSLFYRAHVQMAPTTIGGAALRVLIVYDKQTNAVAPAITDIVQIDAINSQMNLANSKRFVVISDEIIPCIGTAGPQSSLTSKYVKLNIDTEFNDVSSALVNSITTGAVYMVQWQGGGLGTAAPSNSLYWRVRFADT